MNMDLGKVYFSPRLSGERLRIANQVRPGEDILVAFAGIGPYALIIAKQQPDCDVWAVEINKDAFNYMKENIRINRMGHQIKPVLGDVRKEVPKINKQYDRIIMIMPKEGEAYLDLALEYSRKGTIIHFYKFIHENDLEDDLKRIEQYAKNFNKKVKIINWVRAGSYVSRVWRWCIELQVK